MNWFSKLLITALFSLSFQAAFADPKAKKEETPKPAEKKDEAEKKPKMIKLKTEKFEAAVELDGIIESQVNTPISIRPESWAELVVKEVSPYGSHVKKGDLLLELETEKLEKSIAEEEKNLPLAELKFKNAKIDLDVKLKSHPLTLEQAKLSREQRKADFAYYEKVTLPNSKRNTKESLKSSKNYLAYAEEELKQLKKMYENDDMTEETEEIILKRAQDSVDRNQWSVEQMELSTKRSLATTIPRQYDSRKRGMELSKISDEVAELKSNQTLEISKMELASQERALEKSQKKLADLKSDLTHMSIKAPHDGVVYYGANTLGKFTTSAVVSKKLIPGGRIGSNETVITLVDPKKLQIRTVVPESKLKELKEGLKATATMKWNDEIELDSSVKKITYVPLATSGFDVIFSIDSKTDQPIYPGMGSKIKLITYQSDKAIVVPKSSIKKEDKKSYVTMKDGTKRYVITGATSKDKQVILKGVKAGEEIREGEAKAAAATPAKKAVPAKK